MGGAFEGGVESMNDAGKTLEQNHEESPCCGGDVTEYTDHYMCVVCGGTVTEWGDPRGSVEDMDKADNNASSLRVLRIMKRDNHEQYIKVCVDERVAQRMILDKDAQIKKSATSQLYKAQTLKKGLSHVLDIVDDEIKKLTENDD